jgi:lipopolysaccharide transport protein LptA
MRKIWPIVACVGFCSQGYSFTFSGETKAKQPVEIQADEGISCNQETHVCRAKGRVSIIQGSVRLQAHEVVAHLVRLDDAHQSLDRIEAKGGVVIESLNNPQKLTADHGIYDISQGEMVFYGHPVRLKLAQGTVQADHLLTFSEKTLKAVAEGHAQIIKDGQKVEAPILVAYLSKDPEGGYKVREVQAQGGGALKTPDHVFMADHVRHEAEEGHLKAQGHVRIIGDKGVIEGEQAEASLGDRKGLVVGGKNRVKVLLVP